MSADTARLGGYVLPGRVFDPRPAIDQARAAEELRLGTVWISERWGSKDLGALGGAIGQATTRLRVGAATTHLSTRNPMVLASLGLTLQALTSGRFVLGLGRAVPPIMRALGLPVATNQVLVDGADILRRLWRGEAVTYAGPAGCFPKLQLIDRPDVDPPPIALAAIGPKALALAGAHFDGVLLHPFLTPDGVANSAAAVRKAAADAGRDPADVRVIGTVVVAANLPDDMRDVVVGGRAVTYFQIPGFGERLARANGWETAPLEALRAHPQLAALTGGGTADQAFSKEQLVDVSRTLPQEWLTSAAAIGTAAECAETLRTYLRAGADELILHGSTPDLLGPTVAAFASGRP
jgi:probable F420-dependent oxidoreductase